jgi:hypothetical protein
VILFNVAPGSVRDALSYAIIILFILGGIGVAYRWWQWRTQEYVVTNRRLLKVTGIINKRSMDSNLEKINDAILHISLLGRMLNFGNLQILTASEAAIDHFFMLKDPKTFKKTVLEQKHILESDYAHPIPPTPPFRAEPSYQPAPGTAAPAGASVTPAPAPIPPAAAPMAPAAVSPASGPDSLTASAAPATPVADAGPVAPEVAAPAVAAPEVDESLEVTQTLARLADLRDSGAITPEEYEQKKSELLGRL